MLKKAADPYNHAQTMAPPQTARQAGQQAAFGVLGAGAVAGGLAAAPFFTTPAALTSMGTGAAMSAGETALRGGSPATILKDAVKGAVTSVPFGAVTNRLASGANTVYNAVKSRVPQVGNFVNGLAGKFPRLTQWGAKAGNKVFDYFSDKAQGTATDTAVDAFASRK